MHYFAKRLARLFAIYIIGAITTDFAVADARRLRVRGPPGSGGACQFVAHMLDDTTTEVEASGPSVLFRRGDIAVVDAQPSRYLVSFSEDGECFEQAERICRTSQPNADVHQQRSDNGTACSAAPCMGDSDERGLLSYLRSMAGGALSRRPPMERIASIGLGSGALAAWLDQKLPSTRVDAVDISTEVVAAAPCFGVQASSKFRLVVDDGRHFLAASPDLYDAVFVDAFLPSGFLPGCLATTEFFQMIQSKLSPDRGVLALNLGFQDDSEPVLASLRQAFAHVAVGGAPLLTNRIALASQMEISNFGTASEGESSQSGTHDEDPTTAELLKWARAADFKASRDIGIGAPRTDSGEKCAAS